MQINTTNKGKAASLRQRVESYAAKAREFDNSDADLNPKPDRITLSSDHQIIDLNPSKSGHDDVRSADLTYRDTHFVEGELKLEDYYMSSYGKSASDDITVSKRTETERTGFLGLFGSKREVDVYTYKRDHYAKTNNLEQEARFDQNGEPVGFKEKEYAATWGEALKEVVTTPAGLGLTAVAAALGGVPGSLGHLIMGPAGALVTGGLTVAGLAYAKTRPW